jgi:hypothetical protein
VYFIKQPFNGTLKTTQKQGAAQMKTNIIHPYLPSQKMTRKDIMQKIASGYDHFETKNFTNGAALASVEGRIEFIKQELFVLTATRNDMSSHMGNLDDVFNRAVHTHGFHDVQVP